MSQRFQHRAWPLLWRAALVTLPPLFVFVMIAAPLLYFSSARAQVTTSLGVDVAPGGNGATSVGSIQDCKEVQVGDFFSADVYITGAQGLRAWELTFGFDPTILEVTHHDNRLFLAAASFDVSEPTPDSDGRHFMGVATLGGSSSGSGVLARLTFKAKAPGRSPASIIFLDVNGDGRIDIGPRLNPGAQPLGDSDGDGVFDGPVSQAEVAVGQACSNSGPEPTPAPTPEDTPASSGSGGSTEIYLPPVSVLLTDSPPRDTGTDIPFASVLLTDSPPRGASGERLALPSQDGEAADDAAGGDDPPPGSTDAETPEISLAQVGEPAAGLTDGGPPSGASAPQPAGGDSSAFPFWLIGSIAGLLVVGGAGLALIARSLR